jgi:hypothetical protein
MDTRTAQAVAQSVGQTMSERYPFAQAAAPADQDRPDSSLDGIRQNMRSNAAHLSDIRCRLTNILIKLQGSRPSAGGATNGKIAEVTTGLIPEMRELNTRHFTTMEDIHSLLNEIETEV